ncbi:hypothetical protein ACN2CC_26490 [Mesorhizobium muleiense]|uniref:hypothetical protein n=1 Tax=Mesorhizobium muleiense TaxID=1004279 RepID=UPI003AFA1499
MKWRMPDKRKMKAEPSRPKAIIFNCHVKTSDFRRFASCVIEAVRVPSSLALTRWQGPDRASGTSQDIDAAISSLPDTVEAAGDGPVYLEFDTKGSMIGSIKFRPRTEDGPFSSANLRWVPEQRDTVQAMVAFQHRCLSLCMELLREFVVYSAELRPEAAKALCVPEVPLVSGNSHIAVTNLAEAAELYDNPDAFWNAGWEIAEEQNEQRLLARDMDVLGGPEYLERIIDHQWAMARAAKPGETIYDTPDVHPEEAKTFNRGEPRLQSVGYSENEQLLEYSCVLEKGEHVQGWEVYALLAIIQQGRSAEGWPVKTVRIVFLEQWMAEEEKRPLLDIGCHVWHYDGDGELKEIVE